ncbi:fkbM_fam, methyltransferase, FkbM family [Candidatus Nanopelagicaceae bacterium]
MLISINELVNDWNVNPESVLHVGAHEGEESTEYERHNWTPVIWIEAQPKLVQQLREKLNPVNHTVIEAAVFNVDDIELEFKISSNSQSSSLLNFGTHSRDYPEITFVEKLKVKTSRLDTILESGNIPEFINLDIQGVELPALESLGDLINKVRFIYTEVNRIGVYEGCSLIGEIDDFLNSHGFKKLTSRWHYLEGWGDALYVRKEQKPQSIVQLLRSKFRLIMFYKPQYKSILRAFLKK